MQVAKSYILSLAVQIAKYLQNYMIHVFIIIIYHLSKIYYSPKGFWKGLEAVKKLSQEAGVSEDVAKLWLMKKAIWQIYLPAPKNIRDQSLI